MTTGTVSHARTLKGWFVMVKDSKNSHPGNVLWGGWLGVVVVRCGKSHEHDIDQLQNRLSLLPCARPGDGLGLYVRLSNAQVGKDASAARNLIARGRVVSPRCRYFNGDKPGG